MLYVPMLGKVNRDSLQELDTGASPVGNTMLADSECIMKSVILNAFRKQN